MSVAELERLQRIHDGGHLRFVLLHGVISWGVLTALLSALLLPWWTDESFIDILPGAVIAFGVGGVFFGEVMWGVICAMAGR